MLNRDRQHKWDHRFLALAEHIAEWSKDPSTRVGAVIVRPDLTVASFGFNGFPRGVGDWAVRLDKRPIKYAMIVHAEINAILHAREPLHGYCIYTSALHPCSQCAAAIIQTGIARVVSPAPAVDPKWEDNMRIARTMLDEADVEVVEI